MTLNHGQSIIYVGLKGCPGEYRKPAIYIAPDPLNPKRHVIRIKRNKGIGWTLTTTEIDAIS